MLWILIWVDMNSLAPSYRICWSLWILSSEIWISFIRDHQTVHPDGPNSPDCFESIQHRSDVIPVPDFLHRFFFKVSALLNGTFSSTTFPFLSLIDLLSIYYILYIILITLYLSYWTKQQYTVCILYTYLVYCIHICEKIHFRLAKVHRKLITNEAHTMLWHRYGYNGTYKMISVAIMWQIMIKSLYKSSNCQIKQLIDND